MLEEGNKTVNETPVVVDPVATVTEENVSSPEVKTEVQTEQRAAQNEDLGSKLQAQIDNLNKALKQEREGSKKTAELEERLAASQETIDKLKSVFSPQQPVEEKQQENLTLEQVEQLLARRDEEQKHLTQKELQTQAIQKEVKELESEWNGENGKPKYDDKKVLDWQEANDKLYLSPKEAYTIMAKDSIVDWEIKNRMAKKPDVQNVETPGGSPVGREPQATTPMDPENLRSAVLEAMEIVSSDNNN